MTSVSSPVDGAPPELRCAIVGAGPAGFYAALSLLEYPEVRARVDMFDRLPAPYGLVRYGVAPDHQKIKSVIKVYERGADAAGDRFRFFGNVDVGRDVSVAELRGLYHAVVFTHGAQSDRQLGVDGEELDQVYAAREFVAWYNCHPAFRDSVFELVGPRAVVVGIGNVAIDVARILCRTPEELALTDISAAAEAALAASGIREVDILARRGPLQAACTPVELKELTQMAEADLVVDPRDVALDPVSKALLDRGAVPTANVKVYEILKAQAGRAPRPGRKILRLRFYVSPIAILGEDRVEGVRLQRNRLVEKADGWIAVEGTEEEHALACEVVFRSIGYKVEPFPGLPFDAARSRIPHKDGQILDAADGTAQAGLFVAGWAKRGPSGVIGTNKPDAVETVRSVLEAFRAGALPAPGPGDAAELLAERGVRFVSFPEWRALDQLEVSAGAEVGRPRIKFDATADFLAALE